LLLFDDARCCSTVGVLLLKICSIATAVDVAFPFTFEGFVVGSYLPVLTFFSNSKINYLMDISHHFISLLLYLDFFGFLPWGLF
jgi:hypothetical protein